MFRQGVLCVVRELYGLSGSCMFRQGQYRIFVTWLNLGIETTKKEVTICGIYAGQDVYLLE